MASADGAGYLDGRGTGALRDFSVTPRVLLVMAWAVPIGALGAAAAWVLLRLIALITELVFAGRLSTAPMSPAASTFPWPWLLLAPVVGGLVVGLIARFGSEAIRGHGMPEAIEAILIRRSRVAPRVAVLKPISAAISIGTGGPFGAEGPVIMTGGALGSLVAQQLRLSADERKSLMVAGAAAGMAATFNAPLASVLLAVELLLFEWRPRSFLPVTVAVAVATVLRRPLLGAEPVFGVDTTGWHVSALTEGLGVVVGATGGLLAVAVTALVYLSEDGFAALGRRFRVHWMWWPALGGLVIGLGGLVEPRALGVGYDVIDDLLTGHATLALVVGILVVKSLIWGLSLGSGTSGGVLAPVFMIGAALGALEGHVLPSPGAGFWALMGLAAVVGGVMRSPLTGVVFTLELTHAWPALLALLLASASAYAVSVLLLGRSVLTEKIARRGYHLSREYDVDPLEVLFVDEVMDPDPATLRADQPLPSAAALAGTVIARPPLPNGLDRATPAPRQRLFPVVDAERRLLGVVPLAALPVHDAVDPAGAVSTDGADPDSTEIADVILTAPLVVGERDTLRSVRTRFADRAVTSAPVVDAADGSLRGLITVDHLLDGHLRDLAEEHDRVRLRRT